MLRCKVVERIRVCGVARIVAGVGVYATLLVVASSAQATFHPGAGSLICGPDKNVYGEEVFNNVTVPSGANCNLIEYSKTQPTIVDGNVTVEKGGELFVYGSIIRGNLSAEGAGSVVLLDRSEVVGNVNIDATSGLSAFFCPYASACLEDSVFGGSVSITKTSPGGVAVAGNLIARDLNCTGNVFTEESSPAEGPTVSNYGFPNTVLGQEFGQCVGL
jgi:hypothetical protein